MDPIIIDSDTQEFDGKTYKRLGNYFRKRRAFLHRDVWRYHNGDIPARHHIHHIDRNGSNNAIANLGCMDGSEHLSMHQKGHGRRPVAALAALEIWRKTEEGRRFASAMGKRNAHLLRTKVAFKCEWCGKDYEAEKTGSNRFCSTLCKQRSRYASGAMLSVFTCTVCGSEFKGGKYTKPATCSRICRGVISGNARRGVPQGKRGPDGRKDRGSD